MAKKSRKETREIEEQLRKEAEQERKKDSNLSYYWRCDCGCYLSLRIV